MTDNSLTKEEVENLSSIQAKLYRQSAEMGWHDDTTMSFKSVVTNQPTFEYIQELETYIRKLEEKVRKMTFPVKLMLMVSEIAEAMEGDRKDLMDDPLPHRKMTEVELGDAVIRILDAAGRKGYDVAGAIAEKHDYNRTRADHQMANRTKEHGKAY